MPSFFLLFLSQWWWWWKEKLLNVTFSMVSKWKADTDSFCVYFFTDVKETSKVCSQQEQQTTTTAGHWFCEMNDNFCSIILGTISELSAVSQKKVHCTRGIIGYANELFLKKLFRFSFPFISHCAFHCPICAMVCEMNKQ